MSATKQLSESDAVLLETYFDAEREWGLIRAVLDYPRELLPFVMAMVSREHFAESAAGEIFEMAVQALERGEPLTFETIRAALGEREPHYTDKFTSRIEELDAAHALDRLALAKRIPFCPPPKGIEAYASRVRALAAKRTTRSAVERLGGFIEESRLPPDQWFEDVGELLREATEVANARSGTATRYFGQAVERRAKPEVLASGYDILDRDWGGVRPGQTLVVGGFTGHGKSLLMMNLAAQMAERGVPVLIVNLEMQTDEYESRIDAKLTGLPARQILDGELSEEGWGVVNRRRAELLSAKTLLLPDRPSADLGQIMALCQREIAARGVRLCVIDFIQRIDVRRKFNSDYQKVTHVTRQLSDFGRRNRVCMVLGSQLNREISKRPPASDSYVVIPKLSDLRDSGSIAEDADRVLLLYYPDRDRTKPEAADGFSGRLFVSCAKNRGEEVGFAWFNIFGAISTINQLARQDWPKVRRGRKSKKSEDPPPPPPLFPSARTSSTVAAQPVFDYDDAGVPF